MNKDETIIFCRKNSMRRVSVLGYAQQHCPLAYQEYIDKANKNAGILKWLHSVGMTTKPDFNHDPEHLKELFDKREKMLR